MPSLQQTSFQVGGVGFAREQEVSQWSVYLNILEARELTVGFLGVCYWQLGYSLLPA